MLAAWTRTQLESSHGHVQVITVDTEAHSVYTFHTLICLIQICAGGQAFVIDALALHDHLQLLKPALEDPGKLKLLHGGRGDVHWLQRLGIFLCNVLDTAELAIVRLACRSACCVVAVRAYAP